MKKTTTLAAIALLAASMMFGGCKKDTGNDGFFRLATPGYTGNDKTTIDNDRHTCWEANDVLYLNGTTTTNQAIVQQDDDDWIARFNSGIEPVSTHFLVCYPGYAGTGSEANATSFSGSAFTVTFPSSITLDGTTLRCPMMGHASTSESTITFTNVCALLKLTFPAAMTDRTVTITEIGASTLPISGEYTFTYGSVWTANTPTLTSSNNTLTVTTSAQTVYIPVPAGNHKLRIAGAADGTIQMNNAVNMQAGHIYSITAATAASSHVFSVSATEKVRFAPGNLYLEGTTYKFDNQIRYNLSNATSGSYDNSASSSNGQYQYYFTWSEALNGGSNNNPGTFTVDGYGSGWRLITKAHGNYLVEHSPHSYVTINSVNGIIIAPDDCNTSTVAPAGGATWGNTSYAACTNWSDLEAAGCVFLPASGILQSRGISYVPDQGYYWSATQTGDNAYLLYFQNNNFNSNGTQDKKNKPAVRLVLPVNY